MAGRPPPRQDGIAVPIGAKIKSNGERTSQSRSMGQASLHAVWQPLKKKVGKGKSKGSKSLHCGKGGSSKSDKASTEDAEKPEELQSAINQLIEAADGPRVVRPPRRDKAKPGMDAQNLDTADENGTLDESMAPESIQTDVMAEDSSGIDGIEEDGDGKNDKVTLEQTVQFAADPASMKSWVEWTQTGEHGNYVVQAKIVCEKDGVPMKKAGIGGAFKTIPFVYMFSGKGATVLEAQCAAAAKALEKAKMLLPKLRESTSRESDEEVFFYTWCEMVEYSSTSDNTEKSEDQNDVGEQSTPVLRDKPNLAVAKSSITKTKFQPAPKKIIKPPVEESHAGSPQHGLQNNSEAAVVVPPQPPSSPPPASLLGQASGQSVAIQAPAQPGPAKPKLQPVAKQLQGKTPAPMESFTKAAPASKVDEQGNDPKSGSACPVSVKPPAKPILPVPQRGSKAIDVANVLKPHGLIPNSNPVVMNGIPAIIPAIRPANKVRTSPLRPSLPMPKPDDLAQPAISEGIASITGNTAASSSSTSSHAAQRMVQPKHLFAAYVGRHPNPPEFAKASVGALSNTAKPFQEKIEAFKKVSSLPLLPTAPVWDSWGQDEGIDASTASDVDSGAIVPLGPLGLKPNNTQQLSSDLTTASAINKANQQKNITDSTSGTGARSSVGQQFGIVSMSNGPSEEQHSSVKLHQNLTAAECAGTNSNPLMTSATSQPLIATAVEPSSAQLTTSEKHCQQAWLGNASSHQASSWAEFVGQSPSASSFPKPLVNRLGPANDSVGRNPAPASSVTPNTSPSHSVPPAFPPGLQLQLPAGAPQSNQSSSLSPDGLKQPVPTLLDIPSGPSFTPPPILPAKAPPRKPPGPPPGLTPGLGQDFRSRPAGTFADTSRTDGDQISRSRSRSVGRSKGGREEYAQQVGEERRVDLSSQVEGKRALEDIDGRSHAQKSAKTRRAEVLPGKWLLLKHTAEGMFRHGEGSMALFNFSLELRIFEDEWVAIPVIGAQIIVAEWEVFRAADSGADSAGLPQWKPVQLGADTLLDLKRRDSDREDGQACEEHNLVTNTSGWYKITFQAYIRARREESLHSFELSLLYPISAIRLRLVHDARTRIKEFSVEPAAFFEVKENDGQSEVDIKLPSTKSVEVKWHAQANVAAVEAPLPGLQAAMPPGDRMQEIAQAMALEMLHRMNGHSLQHPGSREQPMSSVATGLPAAVYRQWHAASGQQTEDL